MFTKTQATITAAIIAAFTLGAIIPTDTAPAPTPAATETAQSTQPQTTLVSGTIRWASKTRWTVLTDAGHQPTGLSRVEVRKDRIRVHYGFTAAKVGSLQATPDETYTAANVRVGASVGLTYVDLFFYKGTKRLNPATLSHKGANVWITGTFILPQE